MAKQRLDVAVFERGLAPAGKKRRRSSWPGRFISTVKRSPKRVPA